MLSLRGPSALSLVALILTGACGAPRQGTVLPPPSTAPRFAIPVEDSDEIALLQQQLELRRVVAVPGTIYFEADSVTLGRLRELGYRVREVDAEAVDSRVLRVRRRGTEERLRQGGVIIISREKEYWIVSASLARLRELERDGYRLEPIGPAEPRPRLIRMVVGDSLDLQRVANYQVDIHTVADTAGRYTILGGALDMQIDRLREAGFVVEVLPSP